MIDYGDLAQRYLQVNASTAVSTPMGTTFTYSFNDPVGHRVACYHAQSAGVSVDGYAYAINIDYEIVKFDPNWTSTSPTPPCEYIARAPADAGSASTPVAQIAVAGNAAILLTRTLPRPSPMYRLDLSTRTFTPFQVTYNGQPLQKFVLARIAGMPNGDLMATANCTVSAADCGPSFGKPTFQLLLTIDSVTGEIKTIAQSAYVENGRAYLTDATGQPVDLDGNNGILNTMTADTAGNIYTITTNASGSQQFLDVFSSGGQLIRAVPMVNRYFSIPGIFFRD